MTDDRANFDVAIVGAGPAGAACAIELSRAGRRVLLIDRHHFPRPKVCGGCLSGDALAATRRLIGGDPPGAPTSEISFILGRHHIRCRPAGATWLTPRAEYDATLVEEARRSGAACRFGAPARVELAQGRWVVLVDGAPVSAARVIVATGLGGFVEKLGIANRCGRRAFIGQQWVQPPEPPLPALGYLEMHWLRGGYMGLATPVEGQCVIGIAVEPGSAGESPFERLKRMNERAAILHAFPDDAPKRFGARGVSSFPWLPERTVDGNLMLVGDAAGYAEPFTGEGIGQALRSADCAVRAILSGEPVASEYPRFLGERHGRVIRRTEIVGRVLRMPIVELALRALPWAPQAMFSPIVRSMHVGRESRRGGKPTIRAQKVEGAPA